MTSATFERLSVRDVLARMPGAAALPDAEIRAREALVKYASEQTPWYLRVVIGVGAWFGALFLLSFIVSITLFGLGQGAAPIFGCMLIAAATVLRRAANGQFARQVSLVVVFTGQALLIGGVGDQTHSLTAACMTTLVVSAILIAVFPDRVQCFVSTIAATTAVVLMVYDLKIRMGADIVALGLLAAVFALWRFAPRTLTEEYAEIVEPVVHGLVISLFGLMLVDVVLSFADPTELWLLRLWLPVRVGFVLALLWLASMVLIEHGVPLQRPEAMLTLGAILLLGWLTRSTPAIVATMTIMGLAFDRRARGVIALSTAFLLGFGAVYYYSLRLTLLEKSGVLIASGCVCLMACAMLRARTRGASAEHAGAAAGAAGALS